MKLTARIDETRAFYALARWSWDAENQRLIQRIPVIQQIQINIPGGKASIEAEPTNPGPSLQIGQEIRLDDERLSVAFIEFIPPVKEGENIVKGYVYGLSKSAPTPELFWSADVQNETF